MKVHVALFELDFIESSCLEYVNACCCCGFISLWM